MEKKIKFTEELFGRELYPYEVEFISYLERMNNTQKKEIPFIIRRYPWAFPVMIAYSLYKD